MRDIYSISSSLGIRTEIMYFDGPLKVSKGSAVIYTNIVFFIYNFIFIQRLQTIFGPITWLITTLLTTY